MSSREGEIKIQRRRKIRDRLPYEGRFEIRPTPRPLTRKEVLAVMLTSTLVYGALWTSPEGISLGVLTGFLLTSDFVPLRPGLWS